MKQLDGRVVLVVEDDLLIAQTLCRALTEAGATILGPAPTVDTGLALVREAAVIHAAVLDVNLGAELVYPVADALIAREVPFVLATGFSVFEMPIAYWPLPREDKPYCANTLARRLAAICAVSDETTLPPFLASATLHAGNATL
jgi:hypothetical protein